MTRKRHNNAVDQRAELEMPAKEQLREEIQQLAYQFYCQCGHEHGHDLDHWVEAERRVLERYHGRRNSEG